MNNSLAEVHPELVSEWSEKNLSLMPVTLRSVQICINRYESSICTEF